MEVVKWCFYKYFIFSMFIIWHFSIKNNFLSPLPPYLFLWFSLFVSLWMHGFPSAEIYWRNSIAPALISKWLQRAREIDFNLSHVYPKERKYKNKLLGKIRHWDSMIMINLKLKYNSYDSAGYNRNWENIMHDDTLLVMKPSMTKMVLNWGDITSGSEVES